MRAFLESGNASAWQWDLNHRLVLEGVDPGMDVHFSNWGLTEALILEAYLEDGKVFADVPNVLLQEAKDISVYVYDGQTKHADFFSVAPRVKPADYVYTETEVKSWQQLDDRVKALERGGVSGGLTVTDDGNGHVSILPGGQSSIQDDGAGHIKFI